MRLFKGKRGLIAAIAAIALVLAGVGAVLWLRGSWQTTLTVDAKGGDAWVNDHGVGVRVAGGATTKATHITFKAGLAQPRTQLDQLTDQIGEAIEITPDQTIAGKSQVMFRVPSSVPTNVDCTKTGDAAKGRPRSICNAGIEVYNTTMHGWVPLPTTIEHGDVLVADAPHYSEYRAVWAQIRDFTLDTYNHLKVHLSEDTTPDAILAQSTWAFFKQFGYNLIGKFDDAKMEPCEKTPDQDYTVDFTQANADIHACVIKQGESIKVMVGDGTALPIVVRATKPNGVTPDEDSTAEVTTALRNKIASKVDGKGLPSIIVSGLDTGTFSIDESKLHEIDQADKKDKPYSTIPFESEVSWSAVFGDYLTAALSLLFPEERVASQVDQLVDAADCMATGFKKIPDMPAGEIPGKLAEVLKACALPAGLGLGLLDKIGVPELAGTFLKSTKLLAESFQIGEGISRFHRTGHGMGDSAFTVTNANRALLGQWVNQCAGRDDAIDILEQGDDSWVEKELGPDNNVVYEHDTHFKVVREEGKLFMEIEDTNEPGISKGQKVPLRYTPPQNGFSAFINIGDNELWFFWNDNNGAAPCN